MMEAVQSDPIAYTSKLTGRRVIKCHMPMEMQPKDLVEKCKVIYVARNIKDMAVSYFHHLVGLAPHNFQVLVWDQNVYFQLWRRSLSLSFLGII